MPSRTVTVKTSLPLPPAAGVIKLTFQGHMTPSKWANVMHAKASNPGPFTLADLQSLATAAINAYSLNFMTKLASASQLQSCIVQDLSSTTGIAAEATGAHNGGVITAPYSAQVAIVISWKIARHYRGGHPRNYLAGIPAAAGFDVTTFQATFVADIDAGANTFRNSITAFSAASIPSLQLGSVSYYHGFNPDGTPMLRDTPIFDPFTSHAVDDRIDTQRRRLGKPPLSA